MTQINQEQVQAFIELFFCRQDIYAQNKEGTGGFYPAPVYPENYEALEDAVYRHLQYKGKHELIGAYCPAPDGTVVWACLDIDGPDHKSGGVGTIPVDWPEGVKCKRKDRIAISPVACYAEIIGSLPEGYRPHLEFSKSGNSLHMWFFFDSPKPAWQVREDLGHFVPKYDLELFPKADTAIADGRKKGNGNLLWLPSCLTTFNWENVKFSTLANRTRVATQPKPLKTLAKPVKTAVKEPGVATVEPVGRFSGVAVGLTQKKGTGYSKENVANMLDAIDLECCYDDWIRVMAAMRSSGFEDAEEMFIAWSSQSPKWDPNDFYKKWASFDEGDGSHGISIGTLVYMASENGWKPIIESGLTEAQIQYTEAMLNSRALGTGDVALPLPESDADLDIAQALVSWFEIQEDFKFWSGSMWQYIPEKGIWEPQSENWYIEAISQYNGVFVNVAGKSRQIRFSNSKINGVRALFEDMTTAYHSGPPEYMKGAAFKNGFMSPDGLVPHAREHYCTLYFDADFTVGLECVRMESFLDDCFEGCDDAAERKSAIQQLIGNAIFGDPASLELGCFCWGESRSGKSQLIMATNELFPESARSAVAAEQLGDKRELVHLQHSRINIQPEVAPEEIYRHASKIKRAISGEPFSFAKQYKDSISIRPKCFWMYGSNYPIVSERLDKGLLNRFLIIHFPNIREERKRTKNLYKLIVGDGTRLLAWAYQGYLNLKENDFVIQKPQSHVDTVADWDFAADPLAHFIREEVSPVMDLDLPEEKYTPIGTIYQSYRSWAMLSGEKPLTKRIFVSTMVQKGFPRGRTSQSKTLKLILKKSNM